MTDDLKPCPFCGGDMRVIRNKAYHRPQCAKCGADLGGFHTISDAIAAWNTRAIPAALAERDAEIGRLREVVVAARCIRHWHDTLKGEGMVVSATHVRELWDAIDRYDALSPAPQEDK